VLPPDRVKTWNRSLGEMVLHNGSRVKLFSADEPERLRGPQHHGAWCDELAAWRYPDTWDQLQFGLRLGEHPRTVVTTTPKPVRLVRELVKRDDVAVTRGSTFDNAANLSDAAIAELRLRYEGTRLGRQELHAELLEDVPGALWVPSMFEVEKFRIGDTLIDCARTVTAIDPAVTSSDESDETGIITAGITDDGHCPACGQIEGRHVMVLEDSSCRLSPDRWMRTAVDVYDRHGGDRIVAEVNNGGDLVETVLRTVDAAVPYRKVTASRGKRVRAEPVAALYEQGRVHHVGVFPLLEEQMCEWTPDAAKSPDRLDALVWAVTDLMLDEPKRRRRGVRAA
jgi:phage terminase large subunit-like protein